MWKLKENYEGLKELMCLEIGNIEEMSEFSFSGQIVTFAFNLFALKLQSELIKEIPEEVDFKIQYTGYDLMLKYSNQEKVLYSNRNIHKQEIQELINNSEAIYNKAKETLIKERDKYKELKELVNKVFNKNEDKFKKMLIRDLPLYSNKKIVEDSLALAVTNTLNGLNVEIVMWPGSFKMKNSEDNFLFENFTDEKEIEKSMYETINSISNFIKNELKTSVKSKFIMEFKEISPNFPIAFIQKHATVIDVKVEQFRDNVSFFQISSDSTKEEIQKLAESFALFYKFKNGNSKEFKNVSQTFIVDRNSDKFNLLRGSFPQSCTKEMFDILMKQLQGYLDLIKEIKRRNFNKINLTDFRIGDSIRMKVKHTFTYGGSSYTLIEYRTEDSKKTKHVAIQNNFEISKSRYKRISKRQKSIS